MRSGGWEMDRRRYLRALGGVAAGSVGETSQTRGDEREDRAETVPWPEVGSGRIRRWHEVERAERSFEEGTSLVGVSGDARTRIYGYRPLQRRVERRFGIRFDEPMASFFATRIGLRGYFTAGISAEAIRREVEPAVLARLERRDVENLREVGATAPRPAVGGYGAQFEEYRGAYRLPEQAIIVDGDGGGERVRVVERTVDVVSFLAVWKDGTATAYAAGGAYPATAEVRTATAADGARSTLDLGFDPGALRAEIIDLVESVE